MKIIDLFAGPGGWSLALRSLGMDDDLGVENNPRAIQTRDAMGLMSLEADVRDIPSDAFEIDGLIASPPCQSFSAAGKQQGFDDPRGDLVWQPRRFIETTLPDWIAFEEVKEVLPIWKHYAFWLRDIGYSTWAGILNAADYGVPQSRKRSILVANRTRAVGPPQPTHGEQPTLGLFGPALKPWVTMAQALPHRADLPEWCHQRPATTVVRSFCPHIIAAPGWRGPGDGPRQNTPDSVEVDIDEMATL